MCNDRSADFSVELNVSSQFYDESRNACVYVYTLYGIKIYVQCTSVIACSARGV